MSFSARCVPAVLLSLFCLTVNLSAQSTAKQTNKTQRGTVSGRVTIKDKGAAGVVVGMRKNDGGIPSFQETFSKGTTDQDGFYRITNVAAGSYDIIPSAPAFVVADNSSSKYKKVIVGEDENVEGINFSLVRGGVITGKVTDADGRSVIQQQSLTITLAEGAASVRGSLSLTERPAGMVLYLVPSEPDKAEDVLRFFVTEIAADGKFALNNLPPGRYWLLAQPALDPQTATLTKLREPEGATTRAKLRSTAETLKREIEFKPCQNLVDYQLPLK